MPEYHKDAQPWDYEPHFCKHMVAMTSEALHDKSDVALELAIRDAEIERLKSDNEYLRSCIKAYINDPHVGSRQVLAESAMEHMSLKATEND